MVDPLSIAAGIIAVGQATKSIVKCASILYDISSKAGTLQLGQDVELFASQVGVFGSTVSSVHGTIRDHYMKDNSFE